MLASNAKDSGNRKFILVECEDDADTLTAERVRRVINGYSFQGTQRAELHRERLTFTSLKKADKLLDHVESIKHLEAHRFDRIKAEVKDGELIVTGEREVTHKTEGLRPSPAPSRTGRTWSLPPRGSSRNGSWMRPSCRPGWSSPPCPSHSTGSSAPDRGYAIMPAVTLQAHYDGRTILLDEPFDLVPNARLLVTVMDPAGDATRAPWANLAAEGLARAYGEDEPDYGPR